MEKSRKKSIMAAGHICVDIIPDFSQQQQIELGKMLLPGKLIQVGRAAIHLGGSVANTGLALRYFDRNVFLAAKIGRDDFGEIIRQKLSEYTCELQLIEDDEAGTSYSVVIAPPGVDRIFLHYSGANDHFYAADIPDESIESVDHFHFGYPPLMASMYQNDGQQLVALFQRIKQKGITTSLDMAAVDVASPAAKADWRKILKRVLPFIDIFVPSIEETAFMLDRQRYEKWLERANAGDVMDVLSVQEDIAPLAKQLIELGASVIMLKCGKLGIYYQSSKNSRVQALCQTLNLNSLAWEGQTGFIPSFHPKTIVSSNGAGDVCIAAFLAAMFEGRNFITCVKLAAAAGACSLSASDPLSALAPLETLADRIQTDYFQ